MRQPPPLTELPRFPVVGGVALLAIGVSLADWSKRVDVSPLFETPAISQGEVWRLLTSILPHGGPVHLLFNVYWLWVFGTLIEQTYGHVKMFTLIVLLGVGSGAAEFALMKGGIGLSGVGYGLFGMLWVLSRRSARFAGAVDPNTAIVFVAWFFICIGTTITGVMPVANVAHGMGALLGGLLGLAISSRTAPRRALYGGALGVVVGACVAGAVFGRRWVNLTRERAGEWAQLGYLDLGKDRDEAAVRNLSRAVEIDPQLAWAWYNLGVAHSRLRHYSESQQAFARAAALEPGDQNYQRAAGRLRGDGSDNLEDDAE